MSLALLLPGALAALTALALPVLIHLARRDVHRRIDFAALRWLAPEARPRRRLRLEERALLAARLVLLALIAAWLAQPALSGAGDARPFVAVMPGVSAASLATQALPARARLHWLAEGFPALEDGAPDAPQPIASLLRQLDAELDAAAPLIVLATPIFDGADAQIPRLSRTLDWRIVPGSPPGVRPPPEPGPPALHVIADAAHATGARYLQAAASAWGGSDAPIPTHAPAAALPADRTVIVAWLAEGALPEALQTRIAEGGTALLAADSPLPAGVDAVALWRDADGASLAEGAAFGRGRALRFNRALDPQVFPALLEADFPQRLRALLQGSAPEPARADARTWRPLDGAAPWPESPRDLRPWLALLIALAFGAERWLAARLPQRSAA